MIRLTRFDMVLVHCDREKCLTRTGGTDAEDDVVLLDRFKVATLVRGAGRDLLAAGGVDPLLRGEELAERGGTVFGDLLEGGAQLGVGRAPAFVKELPVVFKDTVRPRPRRPHRPRSSVRPPTPDPHAEQ